MKKIDTYSSMRILIVAATYNEIKPLLMASDLMPLQNDNFYSYHNHTIKILITGVGMVSTAFQLGKTLTGEHFDLAINGGIAGSFRQEILIGSVVNVMEDRFSEIGAEEGDKIISFKEFGVNAVVKNLFLFKHKSLSGLQQVKGITVNTVHGNAASIEKAKQLFNPDVESMEGAAFLFACNEEKVPCVQIRSISNFVEERNKSLWNIALAIENLYKTLIKLLDSI